MKQARAVRPHADDDVVVGVQQLVSGTRLAGEGMIVAGLVPAGHEVGTQRND